MASAALGMMLTFSAAQAYHPFPYHSGARLVRTLCNNSFQCGSILGFQREIDGRNEFALTNARHACESNMGKLYNYQVEEHAIHCGRSYGLVQWNGSQFQQNEVPICATQRVTVIETISCY